MVVPSLFRGVNVSTSLLRLPRRLPFRAAFVLIAAHLIAGCATAPPATEFDLIITNGRILDGTGNPWVRGDVAVRNGRIAAVGQLSGRTARR